MDYLDSRFGQPPAGSAGTLQSVTDLELLKKLRREIFKADSLQQCLDLIAQATTKTGKN
ncbi:MAG: hypothetical protein AB1556_16885 [Bacillota bacterium]